MKLKTSFLLLIQFFLLLFCLKMVAQENRVQLIGIVKQDSIFLNEINIINKATNIGTSSNNDGAFTFYAKKGDSILISSLIHKNRTIIVSEAHINSKLMIVYLESEFNELNEVFITQGFSLNLGDVSVDEGTILDYKVGAINEPPKSDNKYRDTHGIGVVSVFRALTKKARQKRRNEKLENKKLKLLIAEFPNKIKTAYGIPFFTKTLGIPKDEINIFLDFCQENGLPELVKANDFLIKDFLIKQVVIFNEIKN